jgi:hypothetical protein
MKLQLKPREIFSVQKPTIPLSISSTGQENFQGDFQVVFCQNLAIFKELQG